MTTLIYGGSSPLAPSFPVTRSVRLRAAASAYFNRTPAAAGNRKTWTYSVWLKRGNLATGALQNLLAGLFGSNSDRLIFESATACLTMYGDDGVAAELRTIQVFRDPSAWYHIVLASDTTQATASNRWRLYVNGVQVTSFSTANYPAQNRDGGINNNTVQRIGAPAQVVSQFFDGYLTEINFIDGYPTVGGTTYNATTWAALNVATLFGSYNPYTNVWEPEKYAGTYGTNGFYLNFRKNNASTDLTIGADSSGNGNNWTPNNITTVSASTTYDSMVDVPGMPTSAAANYPTLNAIAAANAGGTYSNGNLNFVGGVASQWRGAVATQFLTSGKFYFEATIVVQDATNYTMIGACGIQTNTTLFGNYTGVVANGWSVQSNAPSGGIKYNNGSPTVVANGSFTTFAVGDVLQCVVDVTNGLIWFGKNNVWLQGDPAAGTGASYTNLTGPIAPSVSCYNTTTQLAVNFGQRPFSYTPPTGFNPLSTYYFPRATIPNGAVQMAATTYTGTGSSLAITNTVNGVSFQPDFVWIKGRSAAYEHALFDSVRGARDVLISSSTAVAVLEAAGTSMTAFNSNGFSLGTNGTQASTNVNAQTFVAWQWKASNAAAVTNTSGSITSQVSANPSAGFSVVTFTGVPNNASTYTIGHGLGVAPKMMMLKNRSLVDNWYCYHASLGATSRISLNTTAAQVTGAGIWGSTSPTSSVFSLVGNAMSSSTAQTLVAYCFSEIAGYSAFGTYSGNGVAEGPFVYTGFRPRLVLIKSSSAVGSWEMLDSSRDIYNPNGLLLRANSNAAEVNGTPVDDFLSNGFKPRSANGNQNDSGVTYIYAAFAENPFQYALAR